ncbi:uncharacterized protein LOC126470219 [Schistocerca serialis cubense]|uniref:uncharacterized protein LOC126470219 n=1 Tax=Schistocerca serialis cubense TaxID=2023355 RepID=UPI00214E4783|nr:uncharacterized protein LOC126470219 [Schistocerca serialis cubense]
MERFMAEDNEERMAGETAECLGDSGMTQQSVKTNDFVIVCVLTTHNTRKYFVGEIKEKTGSEFLVRFLRKQQNKFVWPEVLDECLITFEQIAFVLNKPEILKRGVRFSEKGLEGFSII